MTYALWWKKPYAPNEPIKLQGDWDDELCAFMYMSSEMSGATTSSNAESETVIKSFFASLNVFSRRPESESMAFYHNEKPARSPKANAEAPTIRSPPLGSTVACSTDNSNARDVDFAESRNFRLASETCTQQILERVKKSRSATAFFERRPRVYEVSASGLELSPSTIKRWDLASTAAKLHPILMESHKMLEHCNGQCLHFASQELLTVSVPNWPGDDLLRNVGGLVVGMVLWLASLLYGAIHAAAWNDAFPTNTEAWLWRLSSCYIAFCGLIWVLLNYIVQKYQPVNNFWEGWMDGKGTWWQNALIGPPVLICGLSFFFARGFIVVEAFISVRSLPMEAYSTPSWTQVFPHL